MCRKLSTAYSRSRDTTVTLHALNLLISSLSNFCFQVSHYPAQILLSFDFLLPFILCDGNKAATRAQQMPVTFIIIIVITWVLVAVSEQDLFVIFSKCCNCKSVQEMYKNSTLQASDVDDGDTGRILTLTWSQFYGRQIVKHFLAFMCNLFFQLLTTCLCLRDIRFSVTSEQSRTNCLKSHFPPLSLKCYNW